MTLSFSRIAFVFTAFLCAWILVAPVDAAASGNPKYGSIVVDADSGQVLSESNADKTLYPASLTKLMTLYLVFEALESKKWTMDTRLYVSSRAEAQEPSKLNVKRGERIKVRDAINALIIKSANDVAVVVAENYAGTEFQFAQEMTRKAKELGMYRTVFKNASGLPHSKQVSTPRDMAILALSHFYNFPDRYHLFSQTSFKYKGVTYRTHNRLMQSYKGMDGFKTGYIRASGFNLVASAARNGKRIIGVVFGGRTGASRNAHMASLLDRGFITAQKGIYVAGSITGTPPVPGVKPNTALSIASLESTINVSEDAYEPQINIIEQGSASFAAIQAAAAVPPVPVKKEVLSFSPSTQAMLGEVLTKPFPANDHYDMTGDWSIQVGAFNSRVKSDYAIRNAQKKAPEILKTALKRNVPVKNKKGEFVFRARLTGLAKTQAYQACKTIPDCMVIAPN